MKKMCESYSDFYLISGLKSNYKTSPNSHYLWIYPESCHHLECIHMASFHVNKNKYVHKDPCIKAVSSWCPSPHRIRSMDTEPTPLFRRPDHNTANIDGTARHERHIPPYWEEKRRPSMGLLLKAARSGAKH